MNCFHVKDGFIVRVDHHEMFVNALEAYMKTHTEDLQINKKRGTVHAWGLFLFFAGPSGDPDTVVDPRLGKSTTEYHQKRIDILLGKRV